MFRLAIGTVRGGFCESRCVSCRKLSVMAHWLHPFCTSAPVGADELCVSNGVIAQGVDISVRSVHRAHRVGCRRPRSSGPVQFRANASLRTLSCSARVNAQTLDQILRIQSVNRRVAPNECVERRPVVSLKKRAFSWPIRRPRLLSPGARPSNASSGTARLPPATFLESPSYLGEV